MFGVGNHVMEIFRQPILEGTLTETLSFEQARRKCLGPDAGVWKGWVGVGWNPGFDGKAKREE